MAACWTCRGLCLPPPQAPSPCPWCRGHAGPTCHACHCTLHFKGQCRFNRGAHQSYRVREAGQPQLCPDCLWLWIQSFVALPEMRPPLPADSALSQHMLSCAAVCTAGAGSASASHVQLHCVGCDGGSLPVCGTPATILCQLSAVP